MNNGEIHAAISQGLLKGDTPQKGVDYFTDADKKDFVEYAKSKRIENRLTPLDDSWITNTVIEAIGNPIYVEDVSEYSQYGLTESGWYAFARLQAEEGITVTEETRIEGAAGRIITPGENHVNIAVRFGVAAASQLVTITWDSEHIDTFVLKATDLAIRNLDYRVTFYVYDIAQHATWEYALTADETFSADKYYYTKNGESYTLAEVTAGETIPADTYYTHSKVTFEGMTRNITYVCNTPIDCPVEFVLPEVEDETHGCWFEIRFHHTGSFSSTLTVPEGVKVASEHTQPETKGFNTVDLHYSSIDGIKMWRFLNTHSTIPA